MNSNGIKDTYGSQAYDPNWRWNTTSQPIDGLRFEDYVGIAKAASLNYQAHIETLMERHGLRYFWIFPSDFAAYELSETPFHEWLQGYKKENKHTGAYDVCIVGPSIKSGESSERKLHEKFKTPDRVRDYLRCMPIVLKQTESHRNKNSIETLERLIQIIEDDPRSIARKNQYHTPQPETGMRAHKTLWEIHCFSTDEEYADFSILAENKIEHESQMDIDRLTRRFMQFAREAHKANMSLVGRCTSQLAPESWSRVFKTSGELERTVTMIRHWGQLLYNNNGYNKGFDQFLGADSQNRQILSLKEIEDIIMRDLKKVNESLHLKFMTTLRHSGLFTSGSSRIMERHHNN